MVHQPRSINDFLGVEGKPCLMLSAVLADNSSQYCRRIAATLQSLLADLHFSLADSGSSSLERMWPINYYKMIDEIEPLVKKAITDISSHSRWVEFEALGTPLLSKRSDGIEAPWVVLILDPQIFNNNQLSQLINQIKRCNERVAGWTLIFAGDIDDHWLQSLDSDKAKDFCHKFLPLSPARVNICIAEPTFERGRPIEGNAFSDCIAISLFLDIIRSNKNKKISILVDEPSEPIQTISTIGLRAVWYSPTKIAQRHQPALLRKLLEVTICDQTGGKTTQIEGKLLPSPFHITKRALSQLLHTEFQIVAHNPSSNWFLHEPGLHGHDGLHAEEFSFTLRVGAQKQATILNDTDPRSWAESIYTFDYFHRKEVTTQKLSGIKDAFVKEYNHEKVNANEVIAGFVHSHPNLGSAAKSIRNLGKMVRETFNTRINTESVTDLADDIKQMQIAIADIPNLPGLITRSFLLLLVQAYIALTLILKRPPFWIPILVLIVLVFLATIGLTVWRRLRAQDTAQKARDMAINNIQKRVQLDSCNLLQELLNEFGVKLSTHLNKCACKLEEIEKNLLANLNAERNQSESKSLEPELLLHLPLQQDEDRIIKEIMDTELARDPDGETVSRFCDILHNHLLKVFNTNSNDTPSLSRQALDLVCDRTHSRLLNYHLRSFISTDEQEDPDSTSTVEWLKAPFSHGRLFLKCRMASERSASGRPIESLYVPLELPELNKENENMPTIDSPVSNVMARFAHVELMRTTYQSFGEKESE